MSTNEFAFRMSLALVAGLFIGLERQLHNKRAGLRTNGLVCIGSAIYVLIAFQVTVDGQGDPTRVIGQVVTGVGFLGAGVIMHQGINVQGLTTAATIWCSSAIGCLAATGKIAETAIASTVIIFINFFLRHVDHFIENKSSGTKHTSQED